MIESYSVDTFRNELLTDVEETKQETGYLGQANYRQLEEVLELARQMTNQHGDSLDQPMGEIIEGCFKEYAKHLDDLEKTDMAALKKRLGEMKGMQRNLTRDLDEADQKKAVYLREREAALQHHEDTQARRGEDKIRQQIRVLQERLLHHQQSLEAIVAAEGDRMKATAEECKLGKD